MASLIRLKQIEGSALLESASVIAANLSAAVLEIVTGSVVGSLPAGVVSGSSQIYISGTIGYNELATDIEVAAISASIAASIGIVATGVGLVTTASFNSYTQSVSQSFSASSTTFNQFSSSLNDIYATDYEVYITSSQIIDQGEF